MSTSALLRAYVEEVLQKYPELRLHPSANDETVLAGRFEFSAQTRGQAPISDCYEISISVASDYPRTVSLVRETEEGRLRRAGLRREVGYCGFSRYPHSCWVFS